MGGGGGGAGGQKKKKKKRGEKVFFFVFFFWGPFCAAPLLFIDFINFPLGGFFFYIWGGVLFFSVFFSIFFFLFFQGGGPFSLFKNLL